MLDVSCIKRDTAFPSLRPVFGDGRENAITNMEIRQARRFESDLSKGPSPVGFCRICRANFEIEGGLMTTNHTELCFGLRHMGSPRAERAADLIEQQAARIAELEKERDALKVDGERLDSGCIVTHERDEFGAEYECERRGVDLRARIDAAMEINKRQSERPDWAECESRGPLVRNSLKHRASELTTAANKCRRAYQKDFMRIPLEWLADAYDEAAAALNRRLSSIAALQAEKEAR